MPSSSSTSQAFEAFYLQHAAAELAADLDQLRTSADFVLPGAEGGGVVAGAAAAPGGEAGAGAPAGKGSGKNGVTDTDNSLQLLIGALRQGTAMFSEADQARVVGAADQRG